MRRSIYRLIPRLPLLIVLLAPLLCWARVGGGESYDSGGRDFGGGSGGSDGSGELIGALIYLAFRHPAIGVPLLIIVALGIVLTKRSGATSQTRRAFQQREAELKTAVSSRDVGGWVNALKLKDPSFELLPLLDKVKKLFLDTQAAWLERDLSPLRPFLSDATFQRLNVQLKLMAGQGVRDAIADVSVLNLQIIGLDQSEWFDTVHVRVKAQMRDAEVASTASGPQALEAARRAPLEAFTEVWSFVRKPGAQTKPGADLSQGKCPNCGAPFQGGAANNCTYCGAVVNSGNYDWTLSEITQGVEHIRHHATVDGLRQARQTDPALNLVVLEDRAALIFWKWVEAQSAGEPKRLSKLSTSALQQTLGEELGALARQRRRKVFLECVVGGVTTRVLEPGQGPSDLAHVEVRWSAKLGIGPVDQRPPALPTLPQRWVFTLARKAGATTSVANGVSTHRCLQCNAPLTDSASTTCDYCGAELASGERDWVLERAATFEAWNAAERDRFHQRPSAALPLSGAADAITDLQERARLLYMMAALAGADGAVGDAERKLLKLCSQRWSVPWANVELALNAGGTLFDRLVPKASPEASAFLQSLVQMALVDGKVDWRERQMLEAAAGHLGIPEQLPKMLGAP